MAKVPANTVKRDGLRAATWTALGLLVASGVGYRVLAQRYTSAMSTVRIERGALGALPVTLGDWQGRDVPLDERIIQATDTDDHINRQYRRVGGGEPVALFVAFGVRSRDLMPHRPEVCYPSAGLTLRDSRDIHMETADGTPLHARVLEFSGSTFDATRITVLNYYIVDGENCPDVSLLRSRAWRLKGPVDYVAQVQVVCQRKSSGQEAEDSARAFAADLDPALRTLLADLVSRSTSGEND